MILTFAPYHTFLCFSNEEAQQLLITTFRAMSVFFIIHMLFDYGKACFFAKITHFICIKVGKKAKITLRETLSNYLFSDSFLNLKKAGSPGPQDSSKLKKSID